MPCACVLIDKAIKEFRDTTIRNNICNMNKAAWARMLVEIVQQSFEILNVMGSCKADGSCAAESPVDKPLLKGNLLCAHYLHMHAYKKVV